MKEEEGKLRQRQKEKWERSRGIKEKEEQGINSIGKEPEGHGTEMRYKEERKE